MKRIEFIIWAGKHGWKHGQKYLNKAYSYFFDKGKIPDPNVILQKAKNYASPRFLADQAKVKAIKPENLNAANTTRFVEGAKRTPLEKARWKKTWKQFDEGKSTPKPTGPGKVIPFPKKPPGKADGGRIDKPLPTRSRDI